MKALSGVTVYSVLKIFINYYFINAIDKVFPIKTCKLCSTDFWDRDACGWKGQLEKREVGNFQVRKLDMKLERMKLESSSRSWKNLYNCNENFPTSIVNFQLKSKISNFSFFPTALSNYMYP